MFALTVETILLLAVALVLGFIVGMLLRRSFSANTRTTVINRSGPRGDATRDFGHAGSAVPAIPIPPTPQAPVLPDEKATVTVVPTTSVGIRSEPKMVKSSRCRCYSGV